MKQRGFREAWDVGPERAERVVARVFGEIEAESPDDGYE